VRRLKRTQQEIWKEKYIMNVYAYAGLTYLGTAVISLLVIGIIVLLNKLMGGNSSEGGAE